MDSSTSNKRRPPRAIWNIGRDGFVAFFNALVKHVLMRFHRKVFWGNMMLTLDKSAGFMDEPKFKKAFGEISNHVYDIYGSPHTIAWRLNTLVWAAQQAVKLEGDFVECGVFLGDMSWVVTQAVDFGSQPKQFYLYDTYTGFSDKYSSREDFPDEPDFLAHAQKVYDSHDMFGIVKNRFKDMPNVKVIKGIVPDVLHQEAPGKIAYLHVDLNSPGAEIGALEVLFDRVVQGGIIVFDDYGWAMFRKLKEAEDAFFAARGYTVMELPTGQGLVVKRK